MKFWLTFPRKIAYPNKIVCETKESFIDQFNRLNGVTKKLYVGLYSCLPDGTMPNVTLDVIGFDIDDIDKPEQFESLMKLHNRLLELDFEHSVLYSTKGAWIFVNCIPRTFPKDLARGKLAAMHDVIAADAGLFFGEAHSSPLDRAIRGDVERVVRMPASYDSERKKWAIFLDEDDLQKGHQHISDLSLNPPNGRIYSHPRFGNKIKIDPENIQATKVYTSNILELPDYEYQYELPKDKTDWRAKVIGSLPDCVKGFIMDPELATWQGRAYATLFLREKGFTIPQTKAILQPFYEKHPRTDSMRNNWNHYEKVSCAELVYKRGDLKFPNCKTLWAQGMCKGKCKNCPGPNKSPAYK